MNLMRWDPFADMDRAMHRFMRRGPGGLGLARAGWEGDGGEKLEWSPSADISETEKEYLIRAELPAVRKEDVRVTVDAGMVTIEGERKQQKEQTTEKFHRVESLYGSFSRSFSVPDDVDVNAIRCESKDGILTVHLPRTPAAKKPEAKQIKVE